MDVKRLLLKWFDKVLLLMALAVALYAASRIRPPEEARALSDKATELTKQAHDSMRASTPPPLPEVRHSRELARAYAEVADVSARSRSAWHPPREKIEVLRVMQSQKITPTLEHPIVGKPDMEPYPGKEPGKIEFLVSADGRTLKITGVEEAWAQITFRDSTRQPYRIVVEVTEFIPDPRVFRPTTVRAALVPGTKNVKIEWDPPTRRDDRAPIQRYILYRKSGGDSQCRRLRAIAVGAGTGSRPVGGSYVDTGTEFGKTYAYHVTSYSDKATPTESPPSDTLRVAIGRDVAFFLKAASKEFATFKVFKWHDRHWLPCGFTAKPGEEIGKMETRSFLIGGKRQRLTVDFRTGCCLVDIDPRATLLAMASGRAIRKPDQRITYQDRDGDLKDKRRSERDAAPWDRFNQDPPAAKRPVRPAAPAAQPGPGEPERLE